MAIVRKKRKKTLQKIEKATVSRRMADSDEKRHVDAETEQKKRELMRKKRKMRMKRRMTVFMFLVICIGIIAAVLKAPFFNIETVYCIGQQNMTEKEILKLADVKTGVNIFTTNIRAITKRLDDNPEIEEATVRRVFPDKIKIRIKEAKPVAYLEMKGRLLLIDSKGKIIKLLSGEEAKTPPPIALIQGIEPVNQKAGGYIAERGDAKAEELFDCIETLSEVEMLDRISSINVQDLSDVQLDYDNRLHILLGDCEKMDYKLKFIKKVISESISDYEKAILDYRGEKLYAESLVEEEEKLPEEALDKPETEGENAEGDGEKTEQKPAENNSNEEKPEGEA